MDSSFRSIAVVLGVASVTLLASCSSSMKPAPGMACALNSDCASGLICTFGLCHSACALSSDCPPGELCVKSGSLGDGGVASLNVCQLPVESKCVYNSQCTPLVCARDEMCRNECLTSADCVSPQVCTDSKVCALSSQLTPGTNDVPVATGAAGRGCALNSDCASGLICTFGLCHSACVVSSDCPSGALCVKSGSVGDGGASLDVCQLPAESKCVYNSDCTTPLVCARDEMCRNECQTSPDCVSPQVCTDSKVCALSSQLTPGTNDVPVVTGAGAGGGAAGGAGSSGAGGRGGGAGGGSGGRGGGAGGTGMDGGTVIGDPCGAPADAGYYGPESVPNNDREHATVLSVGVGYAACIQTPTDVDWYTVTVPSTGQGGYLTIGLTAVAQTASLRTDLYSASTNGLIHTNDGSNAGSSVYTWVAAAAGAPFNIAVSGVNADSRAVGAYTFTASFQPAVEANEPNNDRAQATSLALGTPVQGLFFRGYVDDMTITDPSDYYKITLPAAGMLSATVTGISSSLRGEVALYDSAGGSLVTADSANETPGADAQLMYSAATSGTYYVLVTEPHLGDVPLVGEGRTLPDIATQPYTLTVTSP